MGEDELNGAAVLAENDSCGCSYSDCDIFEDVDSAGEEDESEVPCLKSGVGSSLASHRQARGGGGPRRGWTAGRPPPDMQGSTPAGGIGTLGGRSTRGGRLRSAAGRVVEHLAPRSPESPQPGRASGSQL